MVNYCAVALCNNGSHQERINLSWSHNMADLSFFRFPGDGKGFAEEPTTNSRISLILYFGVVGQKTVFRTEWTK